MFLSCAFLLITQPFLKIYKHTIHQIKAENRERNIKKICLTFIFRTPISP